MIYYKKKKKIVGINATNTKQLFVSLLAKRNIAVNIVMVHPFIIKEFLAILVIIVCINSKCFVFSASTNAVTVIKSVFKRSTKIFSDKSLCSGHKKIHHNFAPFASSSWMYCRLAIFALVSSTVRSWVLLELNSVSRVCFALPLVKYLS